ncbi:YggS family pyridoxal phosphate-dependent enzyme [Desulfothermobacter acidiphilus]|uniref:YggS family pyridoxal phosphate-dependent enzyme n=1 Tax=Desulfothermobacter acidiphilus TaxID=1938353 RepID=UPI003F8CC9CB
MSKIKENLARVRAAVARAALRVGRDPGEVQLVVVTKGVSVTAIEVVLGEGARDLGENRVQDLLSKHEQLGERARWHFIGYLQRNKVKHLVGKIVLLHSLDRWPLAQELEKWGDRYDFVFPALAQVNIAREEQKHGLLEEEVKDFLQAVRSLRRVQVLGLMTIAPQVGDPEQARPFFRRLASLARECAAIPGVRMRYLSMGMTQDFEVAVEEGANLVRVGRAIFQPEKGGVASEQSSAGQGAGIHRL